MSNDIQKNLVFLSNSISNLQQVLLYLEENNIFSRNECEEIIGEKTTSERNSKLLSVIQRKDWDVVKDNFLEILRNTNNEHCANKIEGIPIPTGIKLSHPKIITTRWWPDKKILIESLHKRKFGEKLLVEELHEIISRDKNQMVVICESADASKLTGMGGVGKTLTAKWYAHHYELEYDHILWIDCGEERILQSFKNLARDLDIKNRNELVDVEEFVRESYKVLQEFKCLWIFDNAESYQGEEGILKVLPKYQENFYGLITSRSKEWGTKNIGFGKISDLPLDIFSEEESLEFLRANISEEIKCSEYQLRELCRSLSNLPLALQLAIAALNNGKIDLENYIEKSSAKDLASIFDAKFDDYEKTININIKISLDLISKEKFGKTAWRMLKIFGYIRPDDIDSKFLLHILNSTVPVVKETIDLLEKYSLVTKTGNRVERPYGDGFFNKLFRWDKMKVEMESLSIHRLLQQVIRHHGRKKEKETLRKILGCQGFIEYKLIPFMKYADKKLRKEFPNVKAELLDQEQLKKLLKEKRLEESVQLAKYIHDELSTIETKFNYSICLFKNGQIEECVAILEELYNEEMREEGSKLLVEMGILLLKNELTKDLVSGHLLAAYWTVGNRKKAQEILEENKFFRIIHSKESWHILVEILNSDSSIPNYSLSNEDSTLNCRFGGETKIIELKQCPVPVESNIRLPCNLKELILKLVRFQDGNGIKINHLDLSDSIPRKLNRLTVMAYTHCILSLENISSVEYLTLWNCSLNLNSIQRLSPKVLELWEISFILNGEELIEMNVNEFFDFHKISRMTLCCDDMKSGILLDLSQDISIEHLKLRNIRILDWKEAKWTVKELKLNEIQFQEKTQMKVKQMHIEKHVLEISCLPRTIEKLILNAAVVLCSGQVDLPHLKYLRLKCIDSNLCLSHFHSVQFTHLEFDSMEKFDVNLLPDSVNQIKINYINNQATITGGLKKINKLVLRHFPFDIIEAFLHNFQTNLLVVYKHEIQTAELQQLINKQIQTIAIGRIKMDEKDFNKFILSKPVDRKSEFFLFEGGEGKEIEKEIFLDLVEIL